MGGGGRKHKLLIVQKTKISSMNSRQNLIQRIFFLQVPFLKRMLSKQQAQLQFTTHVPSTYVYNTYTSVGNTISFFFQSNIYPSLCFQTFACFSATFDKNEVLI